MTVRGVCWHIGGLQSNGERTVLIKKREGNISRQYCLVAPFILGGEQKNIALMQNGAHRDTFSVQENTVLFRFQTRQGVGR